MNTDSLSPFSNPIQEFLRGRYMAYRDDFGGTLPDYIPQLTRADPGHFGICLATADGHLYEVGDADKPFTIQSISKPFIYGQALQETGLEAVHNKIGVEPSGDAFNSISLHPKDGRPLNPMINAGAIACTGLLGHDSAEDAFHRLMEVFSSYAGRTLAFDDEVYQSELATGDRNRAIAFMLKTHGILQGDVTAILDLYFRQCSILVTARDLAVMGATLANRGVNPLTRRPVLEDGLVQHVLSVMATCGMYNFAGEWIYEVGMPAKSGVGGGILAVLPGQLGVGVFSPLLDERGNSIRGVKACKDLSRYLGLHMLRAEPNFGAVLHACYDLSDATSRRARNRRERELLETWGEKARIVELNGYLTFSSMEFVMRSIYNLMGDARVFVLDFRRVAYADPTAIQMFAWLFRSLADAGCEIALSSLPGEAVTTRHVEALLHAPDAPHDIHRFAQLDDALEWAEDRILTAHGAPETLADPISIEENELCEGLGDEERLLLASLAHPVSYEPGARIIREGDAADRIYFISHGQVSIRTHQNIRITTLSAGMSFGEFALIDGSARSADVVADHAMKGWELRISDLTTVDESAARLRLQLSTNISRILAARLRGANNKIRVLGAA